MSPQDALEAEFDTVAAWTEEAVAELGPGYAIPAACRGSGSPADLEWLAAGLDLTGDDRFLDAGAGLGGPAAWLVEHLGEGWAREPLLTDPMPQAAAASRRMFGFPAAACWAEHLPLRDGSVDAAWALGILCTDSQRGALLAEVRRTLVPGGRLSLLVLVKNVDELPEAPEGNDFPTVAELHAQLADAGLRVDAEVDAATLAAAPDGWSERADRVEEVVRRDHGDDPSWQRAAEQQAIMGRLIGNRRVVTWLMRTTRT